MTATYLAASAAYQAGRWAAALFFPATGLALFIGGLVRRSAARTAPRMMWPPAAAYPAQSSPTGYSPYAQTGPHSALGPIGHPSNQHIPMAPPPPRRSGGTALIVVGAVLMAVGGLGLFAMFAQSVGGGRQADLEIGNCAGAEAWSADLRSIRDVKRIDCSSADAVEQLVTTADNSGPCPDGKTGSDSSYDTLSSGSIRLCFQRNLLEDNCYQIDSTRGPPIAHATCGSTAATSTSTMIRVVKRIDGSSDISVCPSGTAGVSYPKPARTYCIEAA